MLKNYLQKITDTTRQGDAREESYYPHLSTLVDNFGDKIGKKKIHVTILPKKTDAGNPDFRIWDGTQHIVGYIEAKVPGTDLNRIETSEQLERYRGTFPNLILTDFYEFRLYRDGKLVEKVAIGRPIIAKKLKTTPPVEKENEFNDLFEKFFAFSLPKVFTAESLAVELAKRTRFLKEEVVFEELQEEETGKGDILGFYEAFHKYLISGLTKEEFADLYSQTIAYGLFAARTRAKGDFNRKLAFEFIPPTIGILRDVFHFISLGKLSQQMEVIIDDIAEVLHVANINKILHDYYKKGKGKDPIIHFYETFLNKYDPSTQEKRGVYYTPEPVVNYIVKSLNQILIRNFRKENGFANTDVTVLDPAGGTLTFLAQTAKIAKDDFVDKFGEGGKQSFIKDHILKNFYAFELMMAPYAIAHLKMSFLLEELGYKMKDNERFKLYLTNTLEIEDLEQTKIPGMASLSEESKQATKIKKDKPILVIMGNPPYSIASYNKSNFINDLMNLYKKDVKDEKNIQILTDDYVKFIRFCHWKLEQTENGIIGLITKNTYINAAAFKGLRKQLLQFFDKVYVLNLHGKLYEKTPEGGKDQNVFDIRVGTAILFLIKDRTKKGVYANLYYQDLYGTREPKYAFLEKETIKTTKWEKLPPSPPYFFFEKKSFSNPELYNSFFPFDKIFTVGTSGIKTHRDHFITADLKQELKNRLQEFAGLTLPTYLVKESYNLENNANFNVQKVKQNFKKLDDNKFYGYTFKPFWYKTIYYDSQFIDRDRKKIMKNFVLDENLGFIIKKRYNDKHYSHIFATNQLTDINFFGGGSYVFPLYTISENADIFDGNKKSNIDPEFEKSLKEIYNKKNLTEPIFYYTYGILHCNKYRNAFPELLKINYPKIPFPNKYNIFKIVAEIGKELVALHLLKSAKLSKPAIKFNGTGDNKVTNINFDCKSEKLHINSGQFFDHLTEKIWELEIGKNQAIQKWIKNRANKTLSLDETIDFCKITTAIKLTFDLQDKLDKHYKDIVGKLLTTENVQFNS